jgi:hypothetical protein
MPAHGSYKMSAAAKAAGIPLKDLTRNLGRKVIRIPGPDPGKGRPRLATLDTIYHIAIGHALIKVFVPPTAAMSLAQMFLQPQRGRALGRLFESGKTLLLVTDGIGSIINLQIDQDISPHLRETTIVVDLGTIISKVNSRITN